MTAPKKTTAKTAVKTTGQPGPKPDFQVVEDTLKCQTKLDARRRASSTARSSGVTSGVCSSSGHGQETSKGSSFSPRSAFATF